MLSYLQKFNNLPAELRGKVSSPEVMRKIAELEKEYGVSLAAVIMKLMVKEISIVDLEKYFVFEYSLNGARARQLVDDLKEKILAGVAGYLGFAADSGSADQSTNKGSRTGADSSLEGWMEEKRQEASVRGSDFFFSPEDEEEVKNLAKKLQEMPAGRQKTSEIEDKIEKIIEQAQLSFSSEDLTNRCRQILKTYLKGIRNRIDTRQALSRPVDSGGLGLDINTIEKIIIASDKLRDEKREAEIKSSVEKIKLSNGSLKSATDILKEVKPSLGESGLSAGQKEELSVSEKAPDGGREALSGKNTAVRDFDYDFSKLKKPPETRKPEIKPKEKEPELKQEQKKLTPDELLEVYGKKKNPQKEWDNVLLADKKIKLSGSADGDAPSNPKEEDKKITSNIVNIKRPVLREKDESSFGKTKMQDVKYVPKLTGPVEELGEMDLTNFRRLSGDSTEAAGKIKEKIEFLEEDSFARRLAGIKAWRQSPLNKLYLGIGRQSIELNKPIDIILKERKSSGEEILSRQEFNAIMSLNKSLRF